MHLAGLETQDAEEASRIPGPPSQAPCTRCSLFLKLPKVRVESYFMEENASHASGQSFPHMPATLIALTLRSDVIPPLKTSSTSLLRKQTLNP